jgi:hypothetical protein
MMAMHWCLYMLIQQVVNTQAFFLNNKVERNFWWLPQQNCYLLNPKQNNKKGSFLSFNHLWKVKWEQIFDNFSSQKYYPLNPKHNNKKGLF